MATAMDMEEDNANAPHLNEEDANDLIADTEEDEPSSNNDGRLFRCFELVGAIALFAIALVVEFVAMPQHIRAIPVQTITSLQETTTEAAATTTEVLSIHVRNLLFDEALNEATMGTVALVFVGLLLPLCLQLAMATSWCNTTSAFSRYRRPFDRYNTLCSYLVAISLTFLIVDILKLYCGYLRPHFYEVCMPDANYEYCTNENETEVREVRRSFPSGHAGLSMSGLGSFSMYLYHRFGVGSLVSSSSSSSSPRDKANTWAHRLARLWSFLAVAPVLLALFIGASRIHDNHHHPVDVVGGWAIGGVAAYFCHHVWFLD